MRLPVKFLALTAAAFALIGSPVLATDISTWKPSDLFVKRNLYFTGHLLTGKPLDGSASIVLPTIAAGVGAGTSPTIAITGNDTAGQITLTAGSTPTASAVVGTVTFGTAFKTNAFVILEPANAAASALAVAAQVYPTSTTTTFALNTGATGLTGAGVYAWNYHAIGN